MWKGDGKMLYQMPRVYHLLLKLIMNAGALALGTLACASKRKRKPL